MGNPAAALVSTCHSRPAPATRVCDPQVTSIVNGLVAVAYDARVDAGTDGIAGSAELRDDVP